MRVFRYRIGLFVVVGLLVGLSVAEPAQADAVRVAVAANFSATLEKLATLFHTRTGHTVLPSAASTGQLYAQIAAGAPFDVFLSADAKRPLMLIEAGLAVADSRFVYARGQLVLWSADAVNLQARVLSESDHGVIAVADPRTAPYGAAAKVFLQAKGLWKRLEQSGRIAVGSSVTQAYQFVASGSAVMGFVALSQVIGGTRKRPAGSYVRVPTEDCALEQEAVLLSRAASSKAARAFLAFLHHDQQARQVIEHEGYKLP